MSGLIVGLHLLKRGWQVDVFERVPVELSGRGAGVVTHDELFQALAPLGIKTGTDLGVVVPGRVVFAQDGSVLGTRDLPQVLTSWGKLYEVLMARFPLANYHRGANFDRLEQTPEQVTAHFSDGKSVTGDVLIAADGIGSRVRAQVAPDCRAEYAGYIAWRGLVSESDLSSRARKEMFPYFAFSLPESEQMLGYPVAGEDNDMSVGKRRYNFVWYRPADADSKLPWLLTDTNGDMNGVSIAPNMIRDEVISDMREASQRLLSPQFAELVAKTKQPFIQSINDLKSRSMAYGRVALLGDAAFVARPHCGAGVTKAGIDAVCLAENLDNEDVVAGLKAFSDTRQPQGEKVVQHARNLGAYMQAQLSTPEEQIEAEKYRTPAAVMQETATSDFLRL